MKLRTGLARTIENQLTAVARKSLSNLDRAMKRLEEALDEPLDNKLVIDGTLQRFEFTFDLCWKVFKSMLLIEGIEANTPRESIQGVFRAGWFLDESMWLQMLRDRNETSHVYDQNVAKAIY